MYKVMNKSTQALILTGYSAFLVEGLGGSTCKKLLLQKCVVPGDVNLVHGGKRLPRGVERFETACEYRLLEK